MGKEGTIGTVGKNPHQENYVTVLAVNGVANAFVLQAHVVQTVGNVFSFRF